MKPHEETWTARSTTMGPKVSAGERGPVCSMSKPTAEMRLSMEQAHGVMEERARFIAAAPDMARALMAFVSGMDGNSQGEDLENARLLADDALRKAGVLP